MFESCSRAAKGRLLPDHKMLYLTQSLSLIEHHAMFEYIGTFGHSYVPIGLYRFGPLLVSEGLPMLRSGIGAGPPGVGVLYTSGNTMLTPLLPLWTMPRELA